MEKILDYITKKRKTGKFERTFQDILAKYIAEPNNEHTRRAVASDLTRAIGNDIVDISSVEEIDRGNMSFIEIQENGNSRMIKVVRTINNINNF